MSVKSIFCVFFFIVSLPVFAAGTNKLNYSLGLAYEYSDNIYLAPKDKVDESIIHSLFSTNYQRQSAALNVDFALDVDHQNYRHNTFSDQTKINSLLVLAGTISKDRMIWEVRNRQNKILTSASSLNLPTNTQNSNYFSTGPSVIFFHNPKQTLTANVFYQRLDLEVTPSDYSGYIANASYLRHVTRTMSAEIGVKYNNKDFVNKSINTDYARTDVTLNIKKQAKLSAVELVVGKTYIKPSHQSGDYENIVRGNYQYRLGSKTDFSLRYVRELSDFGDLFAASSNTDSTLSDVGSRVFLLELREVRLKRNFGFLSMSAAYAYSTNDYSDPSLDTAIRKSTINFAYNISASTNANLAASYSDINYPGVSLNYVDRLYSLGITKKIATDYDIGCRIQYANSERELVVNNYDERRLIISGHYYFR